MAIFGLFVFPAPHANASVFSFIGDLFSKKATPLEEKANSQTIALLSPVPSPNPEFGKGGGDITIVDDSALLPDIGPSGTATDTGDSTPTSDQITVYVVRAGDTLSSVAKMFDITPNTIMWANDLTSKTLTAGQNLTILPLTGVRYVVKSGDTVQGIAKKFKGDAQEIRNFNDIQNDAISVGQIIVIPDGEIAIPSATPSRTTSGSKVYSTGPVVSTPSGYYLRPVTGGVKTQGIHGYNAVDIGIPVGTPVYAAAGGEIVIAKYSSGNPWFGGYGNYIAIKHDNGTQTVYGHLSAVYVTVGERVSQGQNIGRSGNTGRSTGPHLHFEVRGARNPF